MQEFRNALGQPVGPPVADWKPARLPGRTPMEGRFCRLEPLEPSRHGVDLHAANSLDPDGRMWTYLPYGPFAHWEEYRVWLETMAAGRDPLFFAIVELTTGRAVGLAAYLRMDPANGSIEVGHVAFSPRLQRMPSATEAMFLMMREAFALGNRRYEWKCHSLNAGSRAAAERLGFTFEGVFRQAAVGKGRSRDTAWYSILDSEWPGLERRFQDWLAPSNFDAEGRQRRRLSGAPAGADA